MGKSNKNRKATKPTRANHDTPATPISPGVFGDGPLHEPDNPKDSSSPNPLPTPVTSTEPPVDNRPADDQEKTNTEPAAEQPATVNGAEGGNGHAPDEAPSQEGHDIPKSTDDEEKTPTVVEDVVEPESLINTDEGSNKIPMPNAKDEQAEVISSEGQQPGSGNEASSSETVTSKDEGTIDESNQRDDTVHSAESIKHEEPGETQDPAIPPVQIEHSDSAGSLSGQDVTPAQASPADGQEHPKDDGPLPVPNVEERQENNDTQEEAAGDKGLADSYSVEDPSNSSGKLEATQEQGSNDVFYDTVDTFVDDQDDKTLTEDQDMDDADFQGSKDGGEPAILGGHNFFQSYEEGPINFTEQRDADPWGLADNPFELQIIVEQPEEDEDNYVVHTTDVEPNHATDTAQSGVNISEGDFENDVVYEEPPADMYGLRSGAVFDISAQDVASEDLLAVANVFANMKSTLSVMTAAFGNLGAQAERLASIGLDVKAAQHIQQVKANLESQIVNHTAAVEKLKGTLQAKIKKSVESIIHDRLRDVIQHSVRAAVEERVRQELSTQIPDDFRKQVISHKRHILEVKTSLHNSEARMYNALQTMPDVNAPLRPLLRPLPTPEQSPVVISISRSSSMGQSVLPTPATAFPQGPSPTPIRRTASNSLRISDTVPPSPSPYFPRDMTTLFGLNPEETKRLLREYGLTSAAASPTVEQPPRPRGLSIVDEDAAEEDPDVHARDLNKFMAHIGVPFLMIPAPKEKHHESAPLSSRSRRRLLTPLIIK